MKQIIAVGLLMLGLGFTIGWVAKPDRSTFGAAPSATSAASHPSPVPAGGRSSEATPLPTRRGDRPPIEKNPNRLTDEQMTQARKMQSEMAKTVVKRIRGKFEKQIEKLAENLNLTPAQKAALTASLEKELQKLDGLDFSDPKSMEGTGEVLKSLTNQSLEEQLAPSLTEEQKVAMADFKARELQGQVDTAALKSLSKLQGVIEFEEGQRDEVYKILAENAEAEALKDPGVSDVMEIMTQDMGIETDPYDLNIQQAMAEVMGMDGAKIASAAPGDQKAMAKGLQDIIDQRIETRVESLRPVLNDKQLDQYRNELKTKGLGIFGPMMKSMGGEGGSD